MILKWFNNLLVKSILVSSDATKREIIKNMHVGKQLAH